MFPMFSVKEALSNIFTFSGVIKMVGIFTLALLLSKFFIWKDMSWWIVAIPSIVFVVAGIFVIAILYFLFRGGV